MAVTVQVSVTVLELPTSPVSVVQLIPLTPVICQVPVPVIGEPFVGPWIVAVNVNVSPRFAVVLLELTETAGG